MNNKGQTILSEYVMIFFVVIAAVAAITTFIQRSLEARVHDARNYMVDSVSNTLASQCPECLNATGASGNQIPYEYEPYYAQMISDVGQNQVDNSTATTGNAQVLGAIYNKTLNEATSANSTSYQMPPQCANGGC